MTGIDTRVLYSSLSDNCRIALSTSLQTKRPQRIFAAAFAPGLASSRYLSSTGVAVVAGFGAR